MFRRHFDPFALRVATFQQRQELGEHMTPLLDGMIAQGPLSLSFHVLRTLTCLPPAVPQLPCTVETTALYMLRQATFYHRVHGPFFPRVPQVLILLTRHHPLQNASHGTMPRMNPLPIAPQATCHNLFPYAMERVRQAGVQTPAG